MQSFCGELIKAGRTCILRSVVVMYLAVGVLRPRFSKQSRVEEERVKVRPFCTMYSGSGIME